jgi:hypothetical protein
MNIQYTATARAEIDGILAYIAGDNPPRQLPSALQ